MVMASGIFRGRVRRRAELARGRVKRRARRARARVRRFGFRLIGVITHI